MLNILVMGTCFVTTFLPTTHEYWRISNLVFQFSPIVYLPLVFAGTSVAPVTTKAATKNCLTRTSFAMIPVYWGSIALMVYNIVNEDFKLNAPNYFMIWDLIGSTFACLALMLINISTDPSPIFDPAQFFIRLVLGGLPFATLSYLAKREGAAIDSFKGKKRA